MTGDPEQIRNDIQRTQRDLSADVDALTEKVSPARVIERRVEHTRGAMTNIKEKIMGSTSSTVSTATDTVGSTMSSAADAVTSAPEAAHRRTEGNPLAAGLIAFGTGWLVSSLLPATAPERHAAAQVKDAATDYAQPLAHQLGEAGREMQDQLHEPARQAVESVKSTATDAAAAVKDQTRSAADDVSAQARQTKEAVTDRATGSDTTSSGPPTSRA
jgi:ElaB/YqjD/DUF883 family membrane-anchored ribosome-binding protein